MIKKELSICQSLMCLDLVSFPVLSQIKPQAPSELDAFRHRPDYILSRHLFSLHLHVSFWQSIHLVFNSLPKITLGPFKSAGQDHPHCQHDICLSPAASWAAYIEGDAPHHHAGMDGRRFHSIDTPPQMIQHTSDAACSSPGSQQ